MKNRGLSLQKYVAGTGKKAGLQDIVDKALGLAFALCLIFSLAIYGQTYDEQRDAITKKYEELVNNGKLTREEADSKKAKELQSLRQTTLMEETKLTDRPMHLYGKVEDQNGDPVEGAVLSYSYYNFSPSAGPDDLFQGYQKDQVKTNKDGLFEIKATGDGKIIIKLLGREGYDEKGISLVDYEYDKSGAYHKRLDPDERFKQPDPKKPEIFKLRKKGEPTFLITSGGRSIMKFTKEGNQAYIINFLSGAGFNCKPMNESLDRTDLIVTSEQKNGDLVIKAKALGDNSAGLVLGRERLFMAPEDGYMIECILPITERHGEYDPLYLYCRTGTPPVYSILNLETYPSERDMTLKIYIQTNPYGGKSFDTGKYMWSLKIIDTLREEAWKFLGEGKYPTKPDFKSLEEEGKKEYLKNHKEKQ